MVTQILDRTDETSLIPFKDLQADDVMLEIWFIDII